MDLVIEKYEIKEQIGQGGFARVFRATHKELGADRVIKVLKADIGSDAREALLAEAKKQAGLSSDRIVGIMDFGTSEDGRAYVVMEYVDGETLRDLLRREGTLPVETAVQYGLAVAEGLAAAHRAGVVHHDVKPENVMITRDGRIKVLDFGIARMLEQEGDTMSHVMGTPAYMAPEQLEARATTASDQWALAVVMVEMITGRRPFEGPSQPVVTRRIAEDEPIIDEGPFADHPVLLAAIQKALAKEPDERHASVDAFADLLREVAVPTRVIVRERESWRRATAAFVLALLVAVGIGYARGTDRLDGMVTYLGGGEQAVPPVPLSAEFLAMNDDEQFDYAGEALGQGRSQEAYAAYAHLAQHAAEPDRREEAELLQAGLLARDLDRPKTARAMYAQLAERSPAGPWAQAALMRKAVVELDLGHWDYAARTLERFQVAYPDSPLRDQAAVLVARCREVAEEEAALRAREPVAAKVTATTLPNNYVSLVALLSSVGAPIVWLLIGFHGSPERSNQLRSSRRLWGMLFLFVSLLVVNFLTNNYENQQTTREILRALSALAMGS